MSEERKTEAGAPVEQAEATDTQVQAAVERAVDDPGTAAVAENAEAVVAEESAAAEVISEEERPLIVPVVDPPNAARSESATEIFSSHTPHTGIGGLDASTAAVAEPAAPAVASPERDGEIRISADHPMAALYMQTPLPAEVRGNRFAGTMIALLATLVFALVYAGVIALWLAPNYPPSTFLDQGLIPSVLNWSFAAATAGFFLALVVVVLIVGRAGWWAYVLGGFLVAAVTWAAALAGFAVDTHLAGTPVTIDLLGLLSDFGLIFPVIAAGLVAREVSVWFGAWIGSRGRRMTRLNAEAAEEYEQAVSEVQAQQ